MPKSLPEWKSNDYKPAFNPIYLSSVGMQLGENLTNTLSDFQKIKNDDALNQAKLAMNTATSINALKRAEQQYQGMLSSEGQLALNAFLKERQAGVAQQGLKRVLFDPISDTRTLEDGPIQPLLMADKAKLLEDRYQKYLQDYSQYLSPEDISSSGSTKNTLIKGMLDLKPGQQEEYNFLTQQAKLQFDAQKTMAQKEYDQALAKVNLTTNGALAGLDPNNTAAYFNMSDITTGAKSVGDLARQIGKEEYFFEGDAEQAMNEYGSAISIGNYSPQVASAAMQLTLGSENNWDAFNPDLYNENLRKMAIVEQIANQSSIKNNKALTEAAKGLSQASYNADMGMLNYGRELTVALRNNQTDKLNELRNRYKSTELFRNTPAAKAQATTGQQVNTAGLAYNKNNLTGLKDTKGVTREFNTIEESLDASAKQIQMYYDGRSNYDLRGKTAADFVDTWTEAEGEARTNYIKRIEGKFGTGALDFSDLKKAKELAALIAYPETGANNYANVSDAVDNWLLGNPGKTDVRKTGTQGTILPTDANQPPQSTDTGGTQVTGETQPSTPLVEPTVDLNSNLLRYQEVPDTNIFEEATKYGRQFIKPYKKPTLEDPNPSTGILPASIMAGLRVIPETVTQDFNYHNKPEAVNNRKIDNTIDRFIYDSGLPYFSGDRAQLKEFLTEKAKSTGLDPNASKEDVLKEFRAWQGTKNLKSGVNRSNTSPIDVSGGTTADLNRQLKQLQILNKVKTLDVPSDFKVKFSNYLYDNNVELTDESIKAAYSRFLTDKLYKR